jgi:hypothetical protein
MVAEKPKIDLKARLGRKSGAPEGLPGPGAPGPSPFGAPPGSVAPPPGGGFGAQPTSGYPGAMAPSGMPPSGAQPGMGGPMQPQVQRPQMPAPGFGARPAPASSIPAPPGFGPKPVQQPAPAAAPVPMQVAQPARPAAIRLEMGEEVVEARRAGRSKILVLVAGVAAVALGIGYGVGGLAEANKGAEAAMAGSKALIVEIGEANAKVTEMSELLKKAANSLKGGKYPSAEMEALGGLEIPFDGTNLMNKGVGRFNQTATTMLFQYSTQIANAKDQKDKVRRLFGGMKSSWEANLASKAKPTVRWGVTVASVGGSGPMAAVAPIKSFPATEKWPSDIEGADGKKKSRYDGGDPTKGDGFIIPVDPATEASVCPESPINIRLMAALLDTARDLSGDNTPGQEVAGVVDTGNKLIDQLKKIGASPEAAHGAAPAAPAK